MYVVSSNSKQKIFYSSSIHVIFFLNINKLCIRANFFFPPHRKLEKIVMKCHIREQIRIPMQTCEFLCIVLLTRSI